MKWLTMNGRRMRRLGLPAAVLALMIVAESTSAGPASGPAGGKPGLQPVPEDLLKEYIQIVKQTPLYQMAKLLPVEVVLKATQEWQKEFDLPLTIDGNIAGTGYGAIGDQGTSVRHLFTEVLLSSDPVRLPDGRYAGLVLRNSGGGGGRTGVESDQEVPLGLMVATKGPRLGSRFNGPVTEYVIDRQQVAEFEFACVSWIGIEDPLTVRLERFSARNEPLNGLLQKLCSDGKVNCSFRQDFVERAKITIDLRDKSIQTCLQVLAATAGGRVLYMLPSGAIVQSLSPHWPLEMENAAKQAKPVPTNEEQALDILKKALAKEVAEMMKARPVVILQVPATEVKE